MHDWPHRLHKLGERATPAVVVTVAGTRGSAPRESGSKMIVTADGVQGTIGGGQLEHGCIAEARRHLDAAGEWRRLRRFALGSQCGQCCGGVVDVLFEHVAPGAAWVASAFATFRAGGRAALVTPLDASPRHREERSDVASSERARQRHEIATPASRARNDGGGAGRDEGGTGGGASPRHREERSDAAISERARQRHEIATPASRARNDGGASSRVISSASVTALSGDARTPAMQRALRAAIDEPGSASFVSAHGGAAAGWLVEPIGPPPLTVVIFGAGHVGRACAQVLGTLDAAVFVVDGRADQLQGDWPDNVTPAFIASPPEFVAHCPPRTCFLVMTHDHALDLDLCREILARPDRRFCGLIGSASKRRRFEKRLRAAGYDDDTIGSLTCPIGVGGITGKHPGEIAVAVAAQLLSLHDTAATAEAADGDANVAVFPGRAPGGRGRA